ncbi:MAG TPA: integrin alpha [Planctomycetota bacterium]|nr:integrin alpha [Planctomycetota bacterium]
MRPIGILHLIVGTSLLGPAAGAQQILQTIDGAGGDSHTGWANSGVGDVNQDGYPDVLIGAPDYHNPELDAGLARIYSGRDLSLLWEQTGIDFDDRYGQFVSEAGDVNRDGWPDFIISAVSAEGPKGEPDRGSAELRSGQDFSIIYKWYGENASDDFGDSSAPAGDVNADGWPDVVVGGRGHDGNGLSAGIARVFSGVDGSVLHTFYGDGPGWLAGSAVDAAGDIDNDGYGDVIVGCRGASPDGLNKAGQAVVYSGFSGEVLLRINGRFAGDGLGSGVAGIGDVDLDGTDDLAIGIWQSAQLGPVTGSAMVVSGVTGDPIFAWVGEHAGAVMGVWVDSAGDANRDGWPDIVVGAEGTNAPEVPAAGKVYVYSGKDGSEIFSVYGDANGDRLGTVVADTGDLNQDGYDDVISGAYWNDVGGHDAGTVRVYSGCARIWDQTGAALNGSNGELNLAACGVMAGADPVTLKLIKAAPSASAVLVVGLAAIELPFHGGVMVPSPDVLIFGLATDPDGGLELDGTWPAGLPSGVAVHMQFWVPDAGGTEGWSASNGVSASTP